MDQAPHAGRKSDLLRMEKVVVVDPKPQAEAGASDSPRINSTIKRVADLGGGVVYLPPGIYTIGLTDTGESSKGHAIVLKSNVHLIGAGFATRLRLLRPEKEPRVPYAAIRTVEPCTNVSVQSLSIEGDQPDAVPGSSLQNGIMICSQPSAMYGPVRRVLVSEVHFKDLGNDGVVCEKCEFVTVERSVFENCRRWGVSIQAHTRSIDVTECCFDCAHSGADDSRPLGAGCTQPHDTESHGINFVNLRSNGGRIAMLGEGDGNIHGSNIEGCFIDMTVREAVPGIEVRQTRSFTLANTTLVGDHTWMQLGAPAGSPEFAKLFQAPTVTNVRHRRRRGPSSGNLLPADYGLHPRFSRSHQQGDARAEVRPVIVEGRPLLVSYLRAPYGSGGSYRLQQALPALQPDDAVYVYALIDRVDKGPYETDSPFVSLELEGEFHQQLVVPPGLSEVLFSHRIARPNSGSGGHGGPLFSFGIATSKREDNLDPPELEIGFIRIYVLVNPSSLDTTQRIVL